MINIPMLDANREKEKEKILEIGELNGFERKKIEGMMKKIDYRNRVKDVTTLQHVEEQGKETWVPLTYHPKVHHKFNKVFMKHG